MASTWSQGQWNLGTWNNAVSGASIVGIQANGSTGSFSFVLGNGAVFTTTGVSAAVDINLGNGWSREEWNTGAWNQPIGSIVAGSGTVFVEDGQSLTSTANNITVTGSAPFTITGEQANISLGDETVIAQSTVQATGSELTTTVNTFAVTANGAITINTPTFEANVELNNDGIFVGTASFLDITGFPLSANLGTITTTSENIIPITGEELTSIANTITLSTEQILSITGNGITITLADIVPNSQNFLSINGNQANANISSLKFWDPIRDNITETWTNIN
jgi:hypothetical protein